MRIRPIIFLMSLLLAGVFTARGENETIFSYANPSAKVQKIGFRQVGIYDVAIKLPNGFAGSKVKGVRVPVVDSSNVTNYSVWISTKLTTQSKDGKVLNVPDVASKNATAVDGYVNADFDTPYTIPENGDVYVGYTFEVKATSTSEEQYPVMIVNDAIAGACYFRAAQGASNQTTWTDYSPDYNYCSLIGVKLVGNFDGDQVGIEELPQIYTTRGTQGEGRVLIVNHGGVEVKEVEYTYTLNGQNGSGKVKFDEPLAAMVGQRGSFTITYPAIYENGTYNLQVEITKVNGKNNNDAARVGNSYLNVVSKVPTKRPVYEEHTGTWCGYCPSGLAGLEALREEIPDAIAISYHGGDVMLMKGGIPYNVPSYPYGMIDRVENADPYYGDGNEPLGIVDQYRRRSEQFTPVDVAVKADWTDATKQAIEVTSTVTFVAPKESNSEYRIGYVVVADGLKGPEGDKKWYQTNNYSGNQTYQNLPKLGEFVNKPLQITDMVFNEVAVYMTGSRGVEGSVPANVKVDEKFTHSMTLNLADMVNKDDLALVQDPDQLKVIAIVYKTSGGRDEQLNAAQCAVPGESKEEVVEPMGRAIFFEEFTGTWCGNCVRGTAAMEWLKENYPNVIRVAYHGGSVGDIMEMKGGAPTFTAAYPKAAVDRTVLCDPYFGTKLSFDNPLGIRDVIEDRMAEPEIATVAVDAYWNDEARTAINVDAAVDFKEAVNADLRIGFIVVADGLTGEGNEWSQVNGCAGMPNYNLPELEKYYNGPYRITDMVYNDVAIFSTGTDGLQNLLPSRVEAGQRCSVTRTISLNDCVNKSGMSLVQDKNKLRIVAFVVKAGGSLGTTAITAGQSNGVKKEMASGIEAINGELEIEAIEYYDLQGRRIDEPVKGIYIKIYKYSEKTQKSVKILVDR